MISRQLLAKLLTPLVLLGIAFGIATIIAGVINAPSSIASRRNDSIYIGKLTELYPAMKDTFTIADVTITQEHWVVVSLKNKQNNDSLRTLLYDPRNSADYIQVIVPPSTRTSFEAFMTPANITLPKEATDVSE